MEAIVAVFSDWGIGSEGTQQVVLKADRRHFRELTDGAAVLEGDFALMGEGKLKLTYLPEGDQVQPGDQVLTSGRGGVYPSGLVAGRVEELRTDASGMTQYAVVQPATELGELEQIFVIKSFDIVE